MPAALTSSCGTETKQRNEDKTAGLFPFSKADRVTHRLSHGSFAELDWMPADSWNLCRLSDLASISAIYSAFYF